MKWIQTKKWPKTHKLRKSMFKCAQIGYLHRFCKISKIAKGISEVNIKNFILLECFDLIYNFLKVHFLQTRSSNNFWNQLWIVTQKTCNNFGKCMYTCNNLKSCANFNLVCKVLETDWQGKTMIGPGSDNDNRRI